MMDYAALQDELRTDPQRYGYAAALAAGDDHACCALLNAVRAGEIVPRGTVPVTMLGAIMPLADWDALSDTHRQYLLGMLTFGSVDINQPTLLANLRLIFAAETMTRQVLESLLLRPGSRAETLFGTGTVVAPDDIAAAR